MSRYSDRLAQVWRERGKPSGPCQVCGKPSTTWGVPVDRLAGGSLTLVPVGDYLPTCLGHWMELDEQFLDAKARVEQRERDKAAEAKKRATRKRAAKRAEPAVEEVAAPDEAAAPDEV
jgi:hypothetical protein